MGEILALLALLAGDWNQFRGPNGAGVDAGAGYPVEFSPSKNAVWKAAIPFGQSSPVVAAGHVYTTAADNGKLLTICLDAKSGRELWRREIKPDHAHKLFRANDPASPTPVADEAGVYAFFGDYGLVAYTPDGKDRWSMKLGPFKNFYGMASSPILTGDMIIQLCDQQSGSYLIAVDKNTGKQRWKTPRPSATLSWTSPLVFKDQLVVLGSTRVDAYYLSTGEPIWWTPVGSTGSIGVMSATGNRLFFSTLGGSEPWMPTFESMLAKYDKNKDGKLSNDEFKGDPDLGEHFGWIDANSDGIVTAAEWNEAREMGNGPWGAVAIEPGNAKGKLPDSAVRWRHQKGIPGISSPLLYQNVYYMVSGAGVITALNASDGKVLKQTRSSKALGDYYASPVAADGKVFFASVEGKVSVVKAGAALDILGVNDLGDEIHATPALSNGRIYVRTRSTLYCFGI